MYYIIYILHMSILFTIHNSCLCYKQDCGIINDYYQYIIELIKQFLIQNPDMCINVLLFNDQYDFGNNNKTIRIEINYEHILVKQGGRSAEGSPTGTILDNEGKQYLVRVDRYHELAQADIVIDYSLPNIHHLLVSGLFLDIVKKHIYISCSIYEPYFIKENRNIPFLTTFINTNEPRRRRLLDGIQEKKMAHTNVSNCFDRMGIENLYKNTKVLINIHQTDHHHTVEELRILPAIQCGIIVISEISPLSELVPYHPFVIWTTYDNILDKAIEVLENYDEYHKSIFTEKTKHCISLSKTLDCHTFHQKIRDTLL